MGIKKLYNSPLRQQEGKQNAGATTPSFVEFDLRDENNDKSASEAIQYFVENCGDTVKANTPKYSHLWNGIEFLKDPKCAEVAKQPIVLDAAMRVVGLDEHSPLYLFSIKKIKKKAGDVHQLHTDMDLATPECRPSNGAVLWLVVKNECPDEVSPLTLVSGSHELDNTAHDELASRGCWTSGPFEKLPCDVDQIIAEVGQQHKPDKHIFSMSGPNQPLTGVAFPSTAWHMTTNANAKLYPNQVLRAQYLVLEAWKPRVLLHKSESESISIFLKGCLLFLLAKAVVEKKRSIQWISFTKR